MRETHADTYRQTDATERITTVAFAAIVRKYTANNVVN